VFSCERFDCAVMHMKDVDRVELVN
jgi:hypothetical protein